MRPATVASSTAAARSAEGFGCLFAIREVRTGEFLSVVLPCEDGALFTKQGR